MTDEKDPYHIGKLDIPEDDKDKISQIKECEIIAKTPFRMLCSGASNSGKTNAFCSIIKKFYLKYFDIIILVSPNSHIDISYKVLNISKELMFDSLNNETLEVLDKIYNKQEEIVKEVGKRDAPKILFIFDDVITDKLIIKSSIIAKIFTRGRHLSISIIISGQKYLSIPKIVRINATNLLIFKCANLAERKSVSEEQSGGSLKTEKDFYRVIDYATSKPYSFLNINNQGDSKHKYRVCLSEIINQEHFTG